MISFANDGFSGSSGPAECAANSDGFAELERAQIIKSFRALFSTILDDV